MDALVARALWEHLAKGSGECPTGIQMQPTLDTSSYSVGSSKGIDTEVGRAEADKERVVCEMGDRNRLDDWAQVRWWRTTIQQQLSGVDIIAEVEILRHV